MKQVFKLAVAKFYLFFMTKLLKAFVYIKTG